MSGFRSATRGRLRPRRHRRAERETKSERLRVPGHVPTPPVPRPGSRAAGLPQGRPHFFQRPENLIFIGVSIDPLRQFEAERCANTTVRAVENPWNMFSLCPRLSSDTSYAPAVHRRCGPTAIYRQRRMAHSGILRVKFAVELILNLENPART
jgi:hypothetical protein